MPTRKQRRREAKSKRHEYEFVYVDSEGNELDELPEGLEPEEREKPERRNGAKPTATAAKKSSPSPRGRREPPPPSWDRALKRGGLLGIVVFVLFSLTAKGHWASAIPLAALYTIMFIPFTYMIDRFAYRRWQARQQGGGPRPTPRKR